MINLATTRRTEAHEFRPWPKAAIGAPAECFDCGQPKDAAIHRAPQPAEPQTCCKRCGNPEHLHGPRPDSAVDDGFGGDTFRWWHPFEPASDTPAERCPDCGCGPAQHNAVNRVPAGLVAHCGGCGSCWKSLNTPFVEVVRKDIEAGTPPVPEATQDAPPERKPLRFRITYTDHGYKVSIPRYDGGEVVAATDYDVLASTAESLAEALREAKRIIRLNVSISDDGWAVYEQNSPAMRQINAALARWEGKGQS